jgi:hypothetical protein
MTDTVIKTSRMIEGTLRQRVMEAKTRISKAHFYSDDTRIAHIIEKKISKLVRERLEEGDEIFEEALFGNKGYYSKLSPILEHFSDDVLKGRTFSSSTRDSLKNYDIAKTIRSLEDVYGLEDNFNPELVIYPERNSNIRWRRFRRSTATSIVTAGAFGIYFSSRYAGHEIPGFDNFLTRAEVLFSWLAGWNASTGRIKAETQSAVDSLKKAAYAADIYLAQVLRPAYDKYPERDEDKTLGMLIEESERDLFEASFTHP